MLNRVDVRAQLPSTILKRELILFHQTVLLFGLLSDHPKLIECIGEMQLCTINAPAALNERVDVPSLRPGLKERS